MSEGGGLSGGFVQEGFVGGGSLFQGFFPSFVGVWVVQGGFVPGGCWLFFLGKGVLSGVREFVLESYFLITIITNIVINFQYV